VSTSAGMNSRLLKASLTRLHDETAALMSQDISKHFGASDTLATRFNELLAQAKTLYPSQPLITGIQEIALVHANFSDPSSFSKMEAEQQDIKIKTLQLKDTLDII